MLVVVISNAESTSALCTLQKFPSRLLLIDVSLSTHKRALQNEQPFDRIQTKSTWYIWSTHFTPAFCRERHVKNFPKDSMVALANYDSNALSLFSNPRHNKHIKALIEGMI